jgi:hypothetical protein
LEGGERERERLRNEIHTIKEKILILSERWINENETERESNETKRARKLII